MISATVFSCSVLQLDGEMVRASTLQLSWSDDLQMHENNNVPGYDAKTRKVQQWMRPSGTGESGPDREGGKKW